MSGAKDPNEDRAPVGEPEDAHGEHPDELLAAYADGSASAYEVAQVEAHLATCSHCVDDVVVAQGAIRALGSLPELPSPWVDAAAITVHGRGSEDAHPHVSLPSITDRRKRRNRTLAAAVGLAAAAGLVAVILLAGQGGPGGGASTAGATAPEAAGAPVVSKQALDRLTAALAGSNGSARGVLSAGSSGGSAEPARAAPLPASPTIAPGAEQGVSCTRAASGQPDSAVVIYAAQATFQGQRVWVIGFVASPSSGGAPRVAVVATTVDGCAVVYDARQALAG
jgi:anti-sigma factor RsiW